MFDNELVSKKLDQRGPMTIIHDKDAEQRDRMVEMRREQQERQAGYRNRR
jgi:hypothetical protein